MFKVAIINCHCVIVLWQRMLPSQTAKARNFDVIFREKRSYGCHTRWENMVYLCSGRGERGLLGHVKVLVLYLNSLLDWGIQYTHLDIWTPSAL
jgi:hypothetical protein